MLGYLNAGIAALVDPDAGTRVSRVFPNSAEPPPPAVGRRPHPHASNQWLEDQPLDCSPAQAIASALASGMWIRRPMLLGAFTGGELTTGGRAGNCVGQSDDVELGVHVGCMGFWRRYVPELRLLHCIPTSRLSTRYLMRFIPSTVPTEALTSLRYEGQFPSRARALERFILALLALPMLLLRTDKIREVIFLLTSRWAAVLGPDSETVAPIVPLAGAFAAAEPRRASP